MTNRLTRRALLGRLGAAVVASPALAIVATRPVDAAPVPPEAVLEMYPINRNCEDASSSPEQEQAERLLQRYLESEEGLREITGLARELMGERPPLGHNLAEIQMMLELHNQGMVTRLDFFQQAYGMSPEEAQDYQRRIDFDTLVNGQPITLKPNTILPVWGRVVEVPGRGFYVER